MLTVPVCKECNSGKGDGYDRPMSVDEEYVRNMLVIWDGAQEHTAAKTLFEDPVIRSFRRHHRLRTSLLSQQRRIWLPSAGGVLQPKVAFPYEAERVYRVIAKMVKGLFFFYSGNPLAKTAVVQAMHIKGHELKSYIETITNTQSFVPPMRVANDVLMLAGTVPPPNTVYSMWVLVFYGIIPFVGITLPAEQSKAIIAQLNAGQDPDPPLPPQF